MRARRRNDAILRPFAVVGVFALTIVGATADEKPSAKSLARPTDAWPCLYGANGAAVYGDPTLKLTWGPSAPPVKWRLPIGGGYSQVVIADAKLILFHRKGDQELVTCLDPRTGAAKWEFGYDTRYVDRYGYNGGPRATPIIAGSVVYTLGAEGKLHAVSTSDGKKAWQHDLNGEYQVEQAFFGVGASPLLENDRLIVNVGGTKTGAGIVALAADSGKTLWTATDQGASYATPAAATIHGKRHVFVFTQAGLVSVDPADGAVRWSIPFRSRLSESANATSPLVVGDLVLVSATYNTGSLCVRIQPDGGYKEVWRHQRFPESHFSNLIHADGFVYGFTGRHESNAELFCAELATGTARWRAPTMLGRGQILRVGDQLLLWGERGHLAAVKIDPGKPQVIASTNPEWDKGLLRHPTWTPPVVVGGLLYLRNEDALLCLDLGAQSR